MGIVFRDKLLAKVKLPQDLVYEKTQTGIIITAPIATEGFSKITFPDPPVGITLITARDLDKNEFRFLEGSMPLLAEDKIFFKGQPTALICGRDTQQLTQYADLLNPVITTDSLQESAKKKKTDLNQIIYQRTVQNGDTNSALQDSFKKIQFQITIPNLRYISNDPYSVFCKSEGSRYIIHTGTQWPNSIISECARALGLKKEQISVKSYPVDIVMQNRFFTPTLLSCYAALLCQKTGSSINMTLSHEQQKMMSPGSGSISFHGTIGVDDQYNITALKADIIHEGDPFGFFSKEILDRICYSLCEMYAIKNILVRGKAMTSGYFLVDGGSRLGSSFSSMILDIFLNVVAENLDINPFEFKKKHILTKGQSSPFQNSPVKETPLFPLIDKVLILSDFERKFATCRLNRHLRDSKPVYEQENKGIGLSYGYAGSGFLRPEKELTELSVKVVLDKDLNVEIETSTMPGHSELFALWKYSSAEILGLPAENINIASGESSNSSLLSRSVHHMTRLIAQCCEQIQKRRFRDPLPLEMKKSIRSPKTKWDKDNFRGDPFQYRSAAVCTVELHINKAEGRIIIDKVIMAVDCGMVLSQRIARSVLGSEILQALILCQKSTADGYDVNRYIFSEKIPELEIIFEEKKGIPCGIEGLAYSTVPSAFYLALKQAGYSDFLNWLKP